jgi:hypothetical protein
MSPGRSAVAPTAVSPTRQRGRKVSLAGASGSRRWALAVVLAAVGPATAQQRSEFSPPEAQITPPAGTTDPAFKSDLLSRVVDGEVLLPERWRNREEALAYEQLVLHARQFAPDVLAKAARRDLKLPLLLGPDRGQFRGALVHLEGSLRLLEEMAPSAGLVGMSEGLTHVYRGWIALDGYKDDLGNVLCIVDFTDLPAAIKPTAPGSTTHDTPHVAVDGYFFKIARYETRELAPAGVTDKSPTGFVYRLAPLFVARTVRPDAPATAAGGGASLWETPGAVLMGTVVLVFVAVGAWFVVRWWLHRDDANVRARLRTLRPGAFPGESADGAEFVPPDEADRGPFDHSPSAN